LSLSNKNTTETGDGAKKEVSAKICIDSQLITDIARLLRIIKVLQQRCIDINESVSHAPTGYK
jgi:hypothetical protein